MKKWLVVNEGTLRLEQNWLKQLESWVQIYKWWELVLNEIWHKCKKTITSLVKELGDI